MQVHFQSVNSSQKSTLYEVYLNQIISQDNILLTLEMVKQI